MLLRIWSFFVPTQAVLTDVDPDGLLGTVDGPAMQRLEIDPVDPFVLVRSVLARGGQLPARREAVAVAVRGTLRRTVAAERQRLVVRVSAALVIRWDAFFVPVSRVLVPRPEKTRRARCRALGRPRRRVVHRSAGKNVAARIRAHRRAARFAALACAEGSA